ASLGPIAMRDQTDRAQLLAVTHAVHSAVRGRSGLRTSCPLRPALMLSTPPFGAAPVSALRARSDLRSCCPLRRSGPLRSPHFVPAPPSAPAGASATGASSGAGVIVGGDFVACTRNSMLPDPPRRGEGIAASTPTPAAASPSTTSRSTARWT